MCPCLMSPVQPPPLPLERLNPGEQPPPPRAWLRVPCCYFNFLPSGIQGERGGPARELAALLSRKS